MDRIRILKSDIRASLVHTAH